AGCAGKRNTGSRAFTKCFTWATSSSSCAKRHEAAPSFLFDSVPEGRVRQSRTYGKRRIAVGPALPDGLLLSAGWLQQVAVIGTLTSPVRRCEFAYHLPVPILPHARIAAEKELRGGVCRRNLTALRCL